MHPAARQFIESQISKYRVLEIGSLDVNGGIRDLFPARDYVGIDRVLGKGVDSQADGATFDMGRSFDLVLCCEAFEHTENWRQIVANAYRLLNLNGQFWGTAAGLGRPAHTCKGAFMSGDGERPEYYENIDESELRLALSLAGFKEIVIDRLGLDIRWAARKTM